MVGILSDTDRRGHRVACKSATKRSPSLTSLGHVPVIQDHKSELWVHGGINPSLFIGYQNGIKVLGQLLCSAGLGPNASIPPSLPPFSVPLLFPWFSPRLNIAHPCCASPLNNGPLGRLLGTRVNGMLLGLAGDQSRTLRIAIVVSDFGGLANRRLGGLRAGHGVF
jgi:hypothetical protein